MKKKRKIKLIVLILAIVAIIIFASQFIGNKKDEIKRLSNVYNELNISQTYLFEMEKDSNNKTIIAKKGNKTIIDDNSKDKHTTTIIIDNNTYLVLHDREEYYIYEQNNVEQSILTDGIGEVINKEFSTGTEKVKGKKYFYEEYAGSTMFIEESTSNISEEKIKTRFYFDDNDNLVYIKTIKGSYQELLKINLQKEVEDSIFEIPSHYAEG